MGNNIKTDVLAPTEKNWDYELSVQTGIELYSKWKNCSLRLNTLTVEFVALLWEAKKQLDSRGNNQHTKEQVANLPLPTWGKYLKDIGIPQKTAYNWLDHYLPDENKLLTTEEYQERKQLQYIEKQKEEDKINEKVNYAVKTGKKLGWDDKAEELFQIKLQQIEKDKQAQKAFEERMANEEKELDEKRKKDSFQSHSDSFDRHSKAFNEAVSALKENITATQEFKDRIRLSEHAGTNPAFYDAIIAYLGELPDDNRRIEACYNIIKICKNIAVDLQKKA